MTKQEREEKSQKEYEESLKERDRLSVKWKYRARWSIAYLIYFPIFLILFTTVLILIFTLGKLGFYFILFAGLLFTSWAAIYLIFGITCNYVSSNTPFMFVLSVLIPIGGFIAGFAMAIHILKKYKMFLIKNTDKRLWEDTFYWKFK